MCSLHARATLALTMPVSFQPKCPLLEETLEMVYSDALIQSQERPISKALRLCGVVRAGICACWPRFESTLNSTWLKCGSNFTLLNFGCRQDLQRIYPHLLWASWISMWRQLTRRPVPGYRLLTFSFEAKNDNNISFVTAQGSICERRFVYRHFEPVS